MVGLLLIVTVAAYASDIAGPFVLDDTTAIVDNPTIRTLWPPSDALSLPTKGTAVGGRPVVNYTLALNYAANRILGVEQPPEAAGPHATVGYHVVNVLLHLLCGLLLFGVVRRTLRDGPFDDGWRAGSDGVAFAAAAVWLLLPVQSEAVDYVIQRTEVLVSLCYLGTLYASIRAWDAASRGRTMGWYVIGAAVCLLGMGSKEVMVTAPVTVLLYDRAFRAPSFRAACAARGRGWFYLALALTAAWLLSYVIRGARGATVGFDGGMPWYRYLYTQGWAVAHYLRLAFWPDQLTLDYGTAPVSALRALPGCALLAAVGLASLVAWQHRAALGFLGAWFFLLLAPSSSVVPITTEIAAERRIYLALAAVVVAVVLSVHAARRRWSDAAPRRRHRELPVLVGAVGLCYAGVSGWTADVVAGGAPVTGLVVRLAIGAGAATFVWALVRARDPRPAFVGLLVALAVGTFVRGHTYANAERLWADTIHKLPSNPRAWDNFGAAMLRADSTRLAAAAGQFRTALTIDSTYEPAWTDLASVEIGRDRLAAAADDLQRALVVNPDYERAVRMLGNVLEAAGDPVRAIPLLQRVVANQPTIDDLAALGAAYMDVGRPTSAEPVLRRALALDGERADVRRSLGGALLDEGRAAEAIPILERAVGQDSASAFGLGLLSLAYVEGGKTDAGVRAADQAVVRAGTDLGALIFAGRALLEARHLRAAGQSFARAVQLSPDNAEAITRYGIAEAAQGRLDEAARLFRRALAAVPGYPPAIRGLQQLGLIP